MSVKAESLIEEIHQLEPGERILLHGVTWDDYENLLSGFENQSLPHFTYDNGTLEIMSPHFDHESCNRLLDAFVTLVCDEMDTDALNGGSTTFKRKDLMKGFEPDTCFYIQNEPLIRGKKKIDLNLDPPPDLVIEVDLTHPSLDKFPIYAQVGVPEIWRYAETGMQFFVLNTTQYLELHTSLAFPWLTCADVDHFLEECQATNRRIASRSFRVLVKERLNPKS